jgi:hypothetical protein
VHTRASQPLAEKLKKHNAAATQMPFDHTHAQVGTELQASDTLAAQLAAFKPICSADILNSRLHVQLTHQLHA